MEEKVMKEKNIDSLKSFAINFSLSKIDLNEHIELNKFDINFILNSNEYEKENILKDKVLNLILCKLYLYHIENYHQGYDLLSMRKNEAKYLIDYFMVSHKIDKNKIEFLNSARPYDLLGEIKNEDLLDNKLKDVSSKIEFEIKKIMSTNTD